jgi:iron complex outermembrane receptor protein
MDTPILQGFARVLAMTAGACFGITTSITNVQAQGAAEEVVVTGSRIRQSPVERTAPVQIATSEDIDRSGEIAVADYLQRLPISGSAINRSNNSSGNLGFPPDGGGIGAGASEIDLRYLSSKRVLVLVDGKRWVRGSSASGVSGAVDLNTIPTAAIARIEVLQDGASPIYGSDALAGVVNIITRSDFNGFQMETNQAAFEDGDGYTQDYSLAWGASSDQSRTFFSAAYARQEAVFASDRALSSEVIFGAPAGVGGSSGTPQGRFIFLDPRRVVDADGDGAPDPVSLALNSNAVNNGTTLPVYDPSNPASGDFHAFGLSDRFNYRPYNYLVTPNRRVNLFGKAEYDVSENVVFKFTAAFTNRESSNQAAPNPLFMGSDAGAGFYLDNVFIPADHPYNPFGIDLDGRSNLITIGRRPLEAGPRIFEQTVNTWIVSGSVEGEMQLGGRDVYWDVGLNWGRNDASQRGHNIFNARKLALALGPTAACAAVPGCVPFNIFGGQGPDGSGSITQDMLDFVTFTQSDQSNQELNDVFANLSGELFDLPSGAFAYALGFEYRKEQGSFLPDATVQAGETADVPAAAAEGQVKVNEVYLELRAPLLSNLPLVESLEVSAAVRSSDYDRIGRDEVYKGGLYWRIFEDLSLRANYAQGFRAPNVGELFNTGSRFDSTIDDPCSNYTDAGTDPTIAANCAALGIPGSFEQLNQQISVQTGGNPALKPESSDTYTIGFGYSPAWAAGTSWSQELTLDVNYYNIELEDAIQAPSAQRQLTDCISTLADVFCDGIVRGGGGAIIAFANELTNIGRIETEGFDWTVTLTTPELGDIGTLRFLWANTYLAGYKEFTPGTAGLVPIERAGTELGSPTRGLVRYKSTLSADWIYRSFVTSLTLRYLSGMTERCPQALYDFEASDVCSNPELRLNKLSSRIYTDLQVGWTPALFNDQAQFAIGINNVLDKDPPPCLSCDLNNYDGTIYPVPGRYVHARAAVKF